MSEEFYSQHMQSMPVPSTQILHQCLHPSGNDLILVLEQQYAPGESLLSKNRVHIRTVELSDNPYSSAGNMTIQENFKDDSDDSLEEDDIIFDRQEPETVVCRTRDFTPKV